MKARPILFSAPMVRALLDDRKTQTRRAVKGSAKMDDNGFMPLEPDVRKCPYGVPGDLLVVRETWQLHERFTDVGRVVYAASVQRGWSEAHEDIPLARIGDCKAKPFQQGFRPSIHMPRWASRLTLEITDVRVERLQDISEADAIAEGIERPGIGAPFWKSYTDNTMPTLDPVTSYMGLWNSINGPDADFANPWVWAVSFAVHRANVDQVLAQREIAA